MGHITLIAGLITEVAAAVVIIWKILSWIKKLADGERCQLRSIMLRTYYKHKENKQIPQYEYENFEKSYAAYKALNGNSFIDKVHDDVREWEIIS